MKRPSDQDLADTAPSSDRSAAASEAAFLHLVVLTGDNAAKHRLPESGSIVLGRSSFADIAIDEPSVSRRHAVLHLGDALVIEDLASANGTHLRGRTLSEHEKVTILPGEIIELGDVSLVIAGSSRWFAASERDERPTTPIHANDGSEIIVLDPVMIRLHRLLDRVAEHDISVLVLGETGTGKEVVAKRIHAVSPRRARPFLELNCASLPESLLESELFGHDRGAFTGAVAAKAGLLEAANGGTVFLDEIGEMPLAVQAKLLRVFESKRVTRLGELHARSIDVRFVSATHRDLEHEVERGAFRRDLYFRLNGITLDIPPLRERTSEIEPLARAALLSWCRRSKRPLLEISDDVWPKLCALSWPGNVRELIHVVERAAIIAGGRTLEPEHFEQTSARAKSDVNIEPRADGRRRLPEGELRREVALVEKERIERALDACGGNQTKAAALLGISRRTLGSRMDEFSLRRPRKGSPK